MIFSGYETVSSAVQLTTKEEQEEMFKPVKELADSLPLSKKQQLLGIFESKPESLRLLPGLTVPFNRFLEHLGGTPAQPSATKSSSLNKPSSSKQKFSPEAEKPKAKKEKLVNKVVSVHQTVEEVKSRLKKWLDKNLL